MLINSVTPSSHAVFGMVPWQALEEQYPHEKISYATFKFKEVEELCIEVIPSCEDDHCVISFDRIPAKVYMIRT